MVWLFTHLWTTSTTYIYHRVMSGPEGLRRGRPPPSTKPPPHQNRGAQNNLPPPPPRHRPICDTIYLGLALQSILGITSQHYQEILHKFIFALREIFHDFSWTQTQRIAWMTGIISTVLYKWHFSSAWTDMIKTRTEKKLWTTTHTV